MSKFLEIAKHSFGSDVLSVANIDDIMNLANDYGINELSLTKSEMRIAVMWYLATVGDKDEEKPKVVKEGKIGKLLGVKLISLDN